MITPLSAGDLPSVVKALASVPGVTNREIDSVECLQLYLARNPGLSFAARSADDVVGFVLCGHDGRRWYLHHLLVLPEYRRQGLATQLVAAALVQLRTVGITKVHVDVVVQNTAAHRFWSRLGWQLRDDIARYSVVLSGGANA